MYIYIYIMYTCVCIMATLGREISKSYYNHKSRIFPPTCWVAARINVTNFFQPPPISPSPLRVRQ